MEKIYLDHASCTPIHPSVIEAMVETIKNCYGNPSNLHHFGQTTNRVVKDCREKVASLISANADEIIFTASGSEANNFAIKGLAMANQKKGKHIVTSQIEHFSILNPLKRLEKMGFTVTQIPVDKYGMINPGDVKKAITPETILVSIMHANTEVGTIEPIEEIGKIVKEHEILFHVDAVASTGVIPVNVNTMKADALSLASNQFYGPPGIGALFLKQRTRIVPFIEGGVQEGGRRAGTENLPGIVGMGKAAELAKREMETRAMHIKPLRDKLLESLAERIDHLHVNGHPEKRLPGNANVSLEYIEGESILLFLDMKGIAVSSGSACTSRSLKSSHVLGAMGVDDAVAQGSILFSLGIDNSEEHIEYVIETLPPIVKRLREMSPLYEDLLNK
ncbi:MAG: cysteine desulfurase [Candidatus Scalindua sp. AMX11]|nr:MAG: cysteine desulfurase [Candidatus Scalindua sp.]NOG84785.1 cysteine desulfurase [Planctomycetota bacterium]RZV98386.1 MAG: cysteine desulfurase [Candidatus Scalindua sp. SCAELEC01]TDE66518.1 MAG: cysteine desulfurase [Candidatus Scalindua sp. AMX11]GJQ58881.1 MAG: cysteine desulfurase IscS [Candidatus Scalindua sp.]